jgi:two-component system nitrogen regulation sensor histidine kinase NtrY
LIAGADEYRQLRNLKSPLKGMLFISLTVLTALITLATILFAFRVAREMTSPIMALVDATRRVAKGDVEVRLEDSSSDELSVLVQAFNRMTAEIGENRRELTETNDLLAQKNLVLDQQRRYVETVLDNIAAGVISFGANWLILTVNKAACNIMGRSAEELLGQNILELLPPADLDMLKDTARKISRRPRVPAQFHYTLTQNSRERLLLVNAVGLFAADGVLHGAVVVFEDITEMEKMQRMAAWREVARRIAHEIKNPLTPIKLSAQRLEKKFASGVDDPVFKQSTQLIIRQVEQLLSMVQEFSSFAKLPEIKPKSGRLEPILEDVVNMFRHSHARIKWNLVLSLGLPEQDIDSAAMQRVFLNILTNAAEALKGLPRGEVQIRAGYNASSRLVQVEVEDNGPDVLTEDERDRMFEPYFSRKKGGSGLGLTIVRSIVAEHRGYVRAAKSDRGGTILTVELPAA